MNKIAAIIVFYNSHIKSSQAYNLLQDDRIDLLLVDNSTDEVVLEDNKQFIQQHQLQYFPMGGNIGLSKAYNKMINIVRDLGYEYILLSDDDTLYTNEYIEKLVVAVNEHKADVIMPVIKDSYDKFVISPAFSTKIPLVPYKEGGRLKINKIYGINSGTCINIHCFDNWQFNEDIFLYFVDSDFFVNNVNKNKLSYYILDCEIEQNLSSSEQFSEVSLKRFKMVIDDARPYFKNQSFPRLRLFAYKLSLIQRFWNQHHDKRIFQVLKF